MSESIPTREKKDRPWLENQDNFMMGGVGMGLLKVFRNTRKILKVLSREHDIWEGLIEKVQPGGRTSPRTGWPLPRKVDGQEISSVSQKRISVHGR